MADTKISDMTLDIALTGTEHVPIVDGGVNKKTTTQAIADLGGGGGASNLDGLSDVSLSSPANGQVLSHNGSSWVNSAFNLDNLADVAISAPVKDDEFYYDDDANLWKNRQKAWANIKDWGCVGDGATNNFTALSTLIATGIDIYVPDGTFLVNASSGLNGISLTAGQRVFGNGKHSILKTTYNGVILFCNDDNWIDGIKFVGGGKASGSQYQTGVFSYQHRNNKVSNCWFEDFGGTGSDAYYGGGIAVSATNSVSPNYNGMQISNCVFYNNYIGVYLSQGGEYSQIVNCTATDNTVGFWITAGNYSVVGCHASANTTGIKITVNSNSGHAVCSGCTFNHNTTAFECNGLTDGHTFSGCMFYYGHYIITNCTGVKFIGCDFWGSGNMTLTGNAKLVMMGCRYPLTPTTGFVVPNVVSGENFNAALADAYGNVNF